MKAYIFDTETTTGDPVKAFPIQVSALEVFFESGFLKQGEHRTEYYDHEIESEYGALAVHGLSLETIRQLPGVLPGNQFTVEATAPGMEVMIGHNIGFDHKVCNAPDVKLIDTLKICRYLWPTAESHTLGAMAIMAADQYLGNKQGMIYEVGNAHNAHFDVLINFAVLKWICGSQGILSMTQLWEIYNAEWRYPKIFSFGKHKGKHIKTAIAGDRGYASWCLRQTDMDPDVLEVIRRAL